MVEPSFDTSARTGKLSAKLAEIDQALSFYARQVPMVPVVSLRWGRSATRLKSSTFRPSSNRSSMALTSASSRRLGRMNSPRNADDQIEELRLSTARFSLPTDFPCLPSPSPYHCKCKVTGDFHGFVGLSWTRRMLVLLWVQRSLAFRSGSHNDRMGL